jgi:hypothetical protein
MFCRDLSAKIVTLVGLALLCARAIAGPAQDAAAYAGAIAKINDAHVKQPGKNTEVDLAKQVPATAKSALKRVLAEKPGPDTAAALLKCGEAALDLNQMEDFQAIRARLTTVAPTDAAKLGDALSRPRFIVRGIGGLQAGWLQSFADVCDGVLAGYDEVFGFKEFSKVSGKKLRFRVHLEPAITKPPHFGPEFPWHSEVDFPVDTPAQFSSPTPKGQMLFYGLCHELGHVIAMWGDIKTMEDKHTWAHYTGVALVSHLSEAAKDKPWMQNMKDVRWRSLVVERARTDLQASPPTSTDGGMMGVWLALHDSVGSKKIGEAMNALDAKKQNRRVNNVRYYSLADFQKALAEVAPAKAFGK